MVKFLYPTILSGTGFGALLELHAEFAVVDILYLAPVAAREEEMSGPQPELTDDVGTEYRIAGFSGTDSDGVRRGALKFVPGVPRLATTVRLRIEGGLEATVEFLVRKSISG
jgi:hypothetical protein